RRRAASDPEPRPGELSPRASASPHLATSKNLHSEATTCGRILTFLAAEFAQPVNAKPPHHHRAGSSPSCPRASATSAWEPNQAAAEIVGRLTVDCQIGAAQWLGRGMGAPELPTRKSRSQPWLACSTCSV